MKKSMIAIAALASLSAMADWSQTAGGTYYYDDPANWSDNTPNGVFSSTLTGDQTVVFTNDMSVAGLTFSYGGDNALTLASDGTGAKTLTIGADGIVSSMAGKGTVTIGGADAAALNLDLGRASRTITASSANGGKELWFTAMNGFAITIR